MSTEWKSLNQKVKKRLIESVVVDANGEIVEGVEVIPKVRYSDSQRLYAQQQQQLNEHAEKNGGFVRAFYTTSERIDERYSTLKKEDFARLLFLATYLQYETNQIRFSNGRAVDRKQLCELLQMQKRRFDEFIARATEAGFIYYNEDDAIFYMNEERFYRGKASRHAADTKEKASTRIYRDTIRELYQEYCKGRSLANLSLIYRVLPMVSYSTNVLSHNPKASAGEIKPIELSELQRILSYSSKQKLVQALQKIKLSGEPIFLIVDNPHNLKEKRVVMNTRVVFAGKSDELERINVLFNR